MQVKQQQAEYREDFIIWRFNGEYHRDRDLPAAYRFIYKKLFHVYYYQHGKYHRTTGPACVNFEYKKKSYYYQDKKYASLDEIKMVEACR